MKKINLLLIGICLIAFNVNAQKWVSTTAQNKNVVLEEFTGIHCVFCPDGHRIANALVAAYPGRVVLINVHAGSYANPTGTELDFRTTSGTSIDASAGVTGYPAGSLNRYKTPWSESRSYWAATADVVLNQPSPVNVAVKAYVDFTTRTLTTEVEVYYTSNAAQSTNKLTVELLQDNIFGTQTGGSTYNPDYWIDGQYKHMHALRQTITSGGAFGEKLDTTTAGHYTYRKYITVLPSSIKNIPLLLQNLKVVAFVSATNSDIYTGAETKVDFDHNLQTDLSLADVTPKLGYIINSIQPKLEVTNNFDQTVTSFDVTATVNGVPYKKSFAGSLAKGQKTTIDWGEIPITIVGSYKISFAGLENINGGTLYDMVVENDIAIFNGIRLLPNAFSTVLAGFDGVMPDNFVFDQTQNTKFAMVNGSGVTVCGANNTTGAVRYAIHSTHLVEGIPGDIIFGAADFTKLSKPLLTFFYAYSDDAYGGTAPSIKVSVSEDNGVKWNEVAWFAAIQTGNPPVHNNWYIPTSAEYSWVGVPLDAYKDKSVIIKISGIPGSSGNALYIDEISITQGNGIADNSITNSFTVYPNPVKNDAKINFSLSKTSDVSFELYNSLGQKLMSTETTRFNTGNQSFDINTTNLEQGTYIGVLKIDGQSFTTKIVK